MTSIKIYPTKIYTSLKRACKYGNCLPNYVQPVFQEIDGLTYTCIGWAVGPAKRGDQWLAYRKVEK